MNIAKYYFPVLKYNDFKHNDIFEQYRYLSTKIRYTLDTLTFMSKRVDAELITTIIIFHLNKLGFDYEKITITDATSGIGGNVLSFAKFFKSVNAVEKDKNTFNMLEKNIDVYKFKNIKIINLDYTDCMDEIKQNVVFIDPPWGGRNYKKRENITLYMSTIRIEKICRALLRKNNIVVLKLPLNYDFIYIYGYLHRKNVKIYIHELNKMFIVVIYMTK